MHIDGWVVDTATTVNVGGAGNGRMVEAARQALNERRDRVRGDGSWFTPDRIADITRNRGLER